MSYYFYICCTYTFLFLTFIGTSFFPHAASTHQNSSWHYCYMYQHQSSKLLSFLSFYNVVRICILRLIWVRIKCLIQSPSFFAWFIHQLHYIVGFVLYHVLHILLPPLKGCCIPLCCIWPLCHADCKLLPA